MKYKFSILVDLPIYTHFFPPYRLSCSHYRSESSLHWQIYPLQFRTPSLTLTLLYQVPSHLCKRTHLHRIFYSTCTACLPERMSSCNALHDNTPAVDSKGLSPCQVWRRVPAGNFIVPTQALLLGWKSWCVSRQEVLTPSTD